MSHLLLGFGRLRPWLGRLEPAHRHMYLLDDQGVRCLGQDTRQIGFWDFWCGEWWCDDWCSHHMQDVIPELFGYGHYCISSGFQHIVHQLFFVFHCLPGTLTHKPLS